MESFAQGCFSHTSDWGRISCRTGKARSHCLRCKTRSTYSSRRKPSWRLANERESEPIAIIGVGCRFPGGGENPEAFWRLLCDGVDAIGEVPPERWNIDDYYDADPTAPGKMNTRWGGFLPKVDEFDAEFFGISPREAIRVDPQHRLLLEVAWEALEDAGLPPSQIAQTKTGVYVGAIGSDYALLQCKDPGQHGHLHGHRQQPCHPGQSAVVLF